MKRIKLEDIEPKVPFEVRDDYFDSLPMRVQARVHEHIHENEHRFTVSWSWRRTALAGMAASVLAVLIWVTYPQKQASLGEETLSQVTDEEIVKYLKDTQITQSEVKDYAPVSESQNEDDVLLQQLNLDENDLKEAIQNEDLAGSI
ncbi:MAG: hypothetical protein MUE30_14620 [Spirosomaceae bacterium]|jgi:hypothetical protein|nr:hypothetical protein [Spirosomataceae bacterium]